MLLAVKSKYFFIIGYNFDFILIFNALEMRMYVVFIFIFFISAVLVVYHAFLFSHVL